MFELCLSVCVEVEVSTTIGATAILYGLKTLVVADYLLVSSTLFVVSWGVVLYSEGGVFHLLFHFSGLCKRYFKGSGFV